MMYKKKLMLLVIFDKKINMYVHMYLHMNYKGIKKFVVQSLQF